MTSDLKSFKTEKEKKELWQIQPTAGCRQDVLAEFKPVSQFATCGTGRHHVDQSLLDVSPQTWIWLPVQQREQSSFQTHLLYGDV